MNSVFYKITSPTERDTIDTICHLLSQREFARAEEALLNHLNEMMSREYNIEDDAMSALSNIQTYYFRFNEYYLNWLQENGMDKEKEIKELSSPNHDNLLLAHMSDPESMDDLVYAVASYVSHTEDEKEMSEAFDQLRLYKAS
jgi:hypothetical protein